ncbi:MAG: FAD-dependent oxidoreductase [Cellvibrionaceae bacterium]|nr:FAD-dependent oxidoreductase [Cellvibrionaceae bacterium]|tara:strand:+ start:1492 stop:2853 length:1362 start_codon:yes stop_codon:yes gene_type:complete
MSNRRHIVIAGAGPAGAIAALGLARLALDIDITVISKPRAFASCEGLSERVLQALHSQRALHALATIPAPSPRNAHWNGNTSSANTERLIQRPQFDHALRQDLADAKVNLLQGQLTQVSQDTHQLALSVEDSDGNLRQLEADYFIDARGRSAPSKGQERLRGPETLSLLQRWSGGPPIQQSMALSLEQGWAWMARTESGEVYTQLTLSASGADLPRKDQLTDFVHQQLQSCEAYIDFVGEAKAQGAIIARSSTSILNCDPISDRSMRIGDAAMAVDPLSGNGIFQSLSSALVAPAIINTWLHKPNNYPLAQQFYRERINHSFMRFARMGRDFYQLEQQWPQQKFWLQRRQWPDTRPAHEPIASNEITIVGKAVVHNHCIESADVVTTPDQPLGIWHIDGIVLAPLVRQLQQSPLSAIDWLTQIEQQTEGDSSAYQGVYQWLQQQRLFLDSSNH